MREILCKTILTDFPHHYTSNDPTYSLNPYRGCTHGCVYCYAPSVLHEEERQWGSFVDVKVNAHLQLRREIRRKPKAIVFISSAVDPYQPVEAKYQITRKCLEILQRHDWPVRILTRSPLILRDIDLIASFSKKNVGISITSVNTPKEIEPTVPSFQRRLGVLRRLATRGIPTWVSIAPIIPDVTDRNLEFLIESIADVRVRTVTCGPLRLQMYPISFQNVRERSIIDYQRDANYYENVMCRIRDLCRIHGIDFNGEGNRDAQMVESGESIQRSVPRISLLDYLDSCDNEESESRFGVVLVGQ